ncbi:glycoside hydrolase family 125 protein [Chryseobacterium gambrini]|uniref:Glycoside hydrolase family 125 protein n=1 Tax=Chryseobacterium gambrini TaxID=373672 RepID=A0AAJ1VM41_9FLAO|nr:MULTISPECIES: glycoside hydrolase family 125 protein [Chryseobacterium]MDN4012349.1 glycoside hydrolase family 125 protein [Chryseobacterium gambrini]MDN4030481.1 glycoside hydrolase family 125 protein [Chryseobacterium gambrini]QWA36782.1 glycoside hydrolase family 125 protein [Chryseobacterium sp. ZHDP1]
MVNRREFIKKSGAGIGFFAIPNSVRFIFSDEYISKRPPMSERKFTSVAVEKTIKAIKKSIADEELAWMFENCFPNTLDTTVKFYRKNNKPYTYVITGDIDAMWLRDSSAQVYPYLSLANEDEKLKNLLKGVINKQVECVLLDPYANAFFDNSDKISEWKDDSTQMRPGIHERKWEIDSLCYVMRLSYNYWKITGDSSIFDSDWKKAMLLILQTFKEQQRKDSKGRYKFQRSNGNPLDTQFAGGYGNPTKKVGLIHSMFRPSDDATFYPFLISSNMFAVVSLRETAEIFSEIFKDENTAAQFKNLAEEVDEAIQKYAVLNHPTAGKIYALEIDGFGNALFMDDANVPNLLSIPYLGYRSKEDEIYKNTRKFSLSKANPWFSEGKFVKGIGGPHIGEHKIWPLGLIMQALTTDDNEEIVSCLKMLKATHAGTGFIHESFDVDNPKDFTRSWFAWANTLFGELILYLHKTKPDILKRKF